MKDRLAWGLMSTADINELMIPAIRAEPRCEVLAVASRDAARAKQYAAQWKIPRAYGSYEALLADPSIDVIYVSLPNSLHHVWTAAAARAGKHVLCEKPLALTVKQCDEIIEAARRWQVFVMEGFMYRYHPRTLKILDRIREGVLGQVQYVHCVFSFPLELAYRDSAAKGTNIRLNPSLGGGCLWDIGSYAVSYARMVAQCEPSEVQGIAFKYEHLAVDRSFFGSMLFPNDVVAQIECSFTQPQRTHVEVVGAKGTLEIPYAYCLVWDGPESPKLITDGHEESVASEPSNAYVCEVAHLCDCISGSAQRLVPLEDSRRNVAVLCALNRSAREGKRIRL
jgi:xylose dehydrogenase (NAD/NADP)